MTREELILDMVSTGRVKATERSQLRGAPLMEAEIRTAIATALPRSRFFPPSVEGERRTYDGCYLESLPDGRIRLWSQHTSSSFPTVVDRTTCIDYQDRDKAIETFIRKEWPTRQIDGISFFKESQRKS